MEISLKSSIYIYQFYMTKKYHLCIVPSIKWELSYIWPLQPGSIPGIWACEMVMWSPSRASGFPPTRTLKNQCQSEWFV